MKQQFSFADDIKIDINNLDVEWQLQPSLCMEYGEQHVEAMFERDKAKRYLDVLYARLDQKYRQKADADGKKTTEASIKSAIDLDDEYNKAYDDYLVSDKDQKLLSVKRESIDHRKKALEKITDLVILGYSSKPYIKKEAVDIVEGDSTAQHREHLRDNARLNKLREERG